MAPARDAQADLRPCDLLIGKGWEGFARTLSIHQPEMNNTEATQQAFQALREKKKAVAVTAQPKRDAKAQPAMSQRDADGATTEPT